ncbi:hypothetical protein ABPG75_007268 [Micractinium tetrahymenae]
MAPDKLAAAAAAVPAPTVHHALQTRRIAHMARISALLHRDPARLQQLLAGAAPEELGATVPMSLILAAALSGWAEAIPLLLAAGSPVAAAAAMADEFPCAHALSLLGPPVSSRKRFISQHGCTPLAAAAAVAMQRASRLYWQRGCLLIKVLHGTAFWGCCCRSLAATSQGWWRPCWRLAPMCPASASRRP